jgi:hypothetical protein
MGISSSFGASKSQFRERKQTLRHICHQCAKMVGRGFTQRFAEREKLVNLLRDLSGKASEGM